MPTRDCKTEAQRYLRNRYTKQNAIQHLLRDGFSQAEIDLALQDVDFRQSQREYDTILTQYPTLIFFGLVAIAALALGWGETSTAMDNLSSVGVALALSVLAVLYFRKWKPSVYLFMVLLVVVLGAVVWAITQKVTTGAAPYQLATSYLIIGVVLPIILLWSNIRLLKKL
jgi:hypothetical protein